MTNSHSPCSADICDAAVDRAMTSFQQAVNSMVSCKRCNGTGYHHGFGEHGHDPDWCEVCNGCQSVPEFDDREAMREALKAAMPVVAQAASNQSSHSERISAADKDRECSIDGGRTQIVVLTREAIKRAIHPFCFSGKNADAIADSILALAPVAPAPVSLLEAIHRLEDMIPKLRIDHSHREAEILHNIIHHLSRLASFEDPKTPGMVSVGLLNTERSTGDRLRVENDQLRAALAAQPPAAPVEKRPPGAGPAGATFGGFEPLSPPQSCSADRETELLATLVYEAMRFAIWAAGQGIMPDEGEPAQGPEDFLYEYSCALEIDDWEGLAEVARDHIRAVPQRAPEQKDKT